MALINRPDVKIVSGGQTGVDRAALDIAIEQSMQHGGWCPRGRKAEDGTIDSRYKLMETESDDYLERTRRNIEDTDGTLILNTGTLKGGTALTRQFAEKMGKPCLVVDPQFTDTIEHVRQWIMENDIHTLNIAGPRSSKNKSIYQLSRHYLMQLFSGTHD